MSKSPDTADPLQAWLAATRTDERHSPAPRDSDADQPADDPAGPAGEHRLSRRLLRVTTLTCVAALALGVAVRRPAEQVSPVAPEVAPVESSTDPVPPPGAVSPPVSAASATLPPADQAAAAVTAVRLATPPDRYIDTAVAESAHPAGTAAVIAVRAVVLDQVGQGWANPHLARYAVAVSTHEPVALSTPWPLPPQQPAPPRLSWQPAPALDSAAQTALEAAGFRSISDVRVRRSDTLPDIVSALCRATAPGESTPRRHEVWLTADAARVLGLTDVKPPIPVPGEQP